MATGDQSTAINLQFEDFPNDHLSVFLVKNVQNTT